MTRWLFAVDPGQGHCGCTLFRDGLLVSAALVEHPRKDEHDDSLASLREMSRAAASWFTEHPLTPLPDWRCLDDPNPDFAVEWPQAYRGHKSQAPVADLLPLAAIGLGIASQLDGHTATRYLPAEWGASGKPKKATDLYPVAVAVRGRLSPIEQLVWVQSVPSELAKYDLSERGVKREHVTDAIAIGLHHLGRGRVNDRKRAYPR